MQLSTLSRMVLRLSIIAGLATCISGPSLAKETAKAIATAKHSYAQSETRMRLAYRKLVRHSKPEARRRLATSQGLWVRFRDAECRYELEATPPNDLANELLYQCMVGLTNGRAARLAEQLECPGVDGTC